MTRAREDLSASELRQEAAQIEESLMRGAGAHSFAAGLSRGLLGPLPDLLASKLQSAEELEVNRRREEKAQMAGAAGTLLGYVGGALTGVGLPGMLGRAGAAAGKVAGKFAGEVAGAGVGQAVGAVARGGLEGGGIALSEATGKSLVDRELGIPGSASAIASAVGTGMAFGGLAGGVLGVALPRTADFLFAKSFNKRIKSVREAVDKKIVAHKERIALSKELEFFERANTPQGLAAYRTMYGRDMRYNAIAGDPTAPLARQTMEQGRWMHMAPFQPGERAALEAAARSGDKAAQARLSDFLRKGGQDPEFVKVLRKIESSDEKIKNTLTKTMAELGQKTREGVEDGVTDLAALAIGGPKMWFIRRMIAPSVAAIQGTIYKGMMKVPAVRWAVSNALTTGKASRFYQKMGVVDGELKQIASSFDKYVEPGRAAVAALKVPPITLMTNKELRELREELLDANLKAYSQSIAMAMASHGVPQEAAPPMIESAQGAISYVLGNMPQAAEQSWADEEVPVPESKRREFAEDLRAAFLPISVIHDYVAGRLTPRAAKAWWATQPDVAPVIAEVIQNAKELAEAHGRKFSAKEKEQMGLLMDPSGAMLGRTKSKPLLQYIQGNYRTEEQQSPPPQPGGPPPPGSPKAVQGLNNNSVGPSMGLTSRLNRT
jgi:hypothetical protein